MGKTRYSSENMTRKTKKKAEASDDGNPEMATEFLNPDPLDNTNIIQFVEQRKRKKKSTSDTNFKSKNGDSDSIKDSGEKKLRFNIDGDIVEPKVESEVDDSNVKKKIRKPRWSEDRKTEARERKVDEPPKSLEEPEKPKSKKKKKPKKKVALLNQDSTTALATSAIQYLQNWQYDRSSWKFSKIKQIWLLRNVFDLEKIPTSVFPILVDYINGSKGGARKKTYESALKIIQNLEEKVSGEEGEDDEVSKCLEEDSEEDKAAIHQRARSILQALSDCT